MYPQVDTQLIFLHSLCGLMCIYYSVRLYTKKNEIRNLNHPLILIPLLIAFISLISSFIGENFSKSLLGAPQIGQGVFWYFDLSIMSIVFSQLANIKTAKLILFINLLFVTFVVSFFTFFPYWNSTPISFYYFTDYLCFYGVLVFLLFTTMTKNKYYLLFSFLLLGTYFSILNNRAAILFWITTLLAGIIYYSLKALNNYYENKKLRKFLFSEGMLVFVVFLISLLVLFCSIYFWSTDFNLPPNIKGTILDAPVVRGKIIENSLYGLSSLKLFLFGNGWGTVSDLLLQNMKSWHYEELRVGYSLHFHTHNEIVEHLVSIGLLGGMLFLMYIYYIFKQSNVFGIPSKLGWLLFFKINCFWFLWPGTLTLYAVVLSFFIFTKSNNFKLFFSLNEYSKLNKSLFSIIFLSMGLFLLYGAHIAYSSISVNSKLKYSYILENLKNVPQKEHKCLVFYNDFNRGGIMLDMFLQNYSSYIFALEKDKIEDNAFKVLYDLQCKANEIIGTGNFTLSLLNTAMQVDTRFYYKFAGTIEGIDYLEKNYDKWFKKALLMSKTMPKRKDLIMPFLSYAVGHNKNEDAAELCSKNLLELDGMCSLVRANKILSKSKINNEEIKKSILLIKQAIQKGIFNEILYGYWFGRGDSYENWGLKGIPLAPDEIFLISNKEKEELEKIISKQY